MTNNPWRLYLVTNRYLGMTDDLLVDMVRQALDGGVTAVQLREKEISTRQMMELGERLMKLVESYKVPLLINDRVDVAHAIGAHGVHLGQTDMPVDKARAILGDKVFVGLSIESVTQMQGVNAAQLSYIAASPVFDTPTKTNTAPAFGLQGLANLCKRTNMPVIGIGGINAMNAGMVIKAGACGVAVTAAILQAMSPQDAAQELLRCMDSSV